VFFLLCQLYIPSIEFNLVKNGLVKNGKLIIEEKKRNI
jgi:hypothetical protein